MQVGDIFSRAVSASAVGGQETLNLPPAFSCAGETHEPFFLFSEPGRHNEEEQPVLCGLVKTTGADFDGDRTDIHDIFSLVWASVTRAFGLSSPFLMDINHGFVRGEIDARLLYFEQCPWNISNERFEQARQSMNAWSAFAFHLLSDVFIWNHDVVLGSPNPAAGYRTEEPKWAKRVINYLRSPKDITISKRKFPLWSYFASHDRGVTIVRMPQSRVMNLKIILTPFAPEMVEADKAIAIFANGIPNAVPFRLVKKAIKLLSFVDDKSDCPIILPIDSHCLFIGDNTIVALRGKCGRKLFEHERRFVIRRRSSENRVFFADCRIEWNLPLSPIDFENLCVDLIRREPGVVRVKLVGTTNERDGGRDILVDWHVPMPHPSDAGDRTAGNGKRSGSSGTRITRIIAQVKSRSRTIGKGDVRDIRDMLEHCEAKGFLLIAHPGISAPLVDYLDNLRKRTSFTEWWDARDIEDRLRRHLDIAKRFPDLVTLYPSA